MGTASQTSAATFDPAEWLDRFQAAAGWKVISDDRLWFGWRVDGDQQTMAARAAFRDVEQQSDRVALVRAHLEREA